MDQDQGRDQERDREGGWDVVVVGAGPAGLACARRLQEAGRRTLVLEAESRPGGRVGGHRRPDGHMIDRGFQVLFTAYPTANALLDVAALDLRAYDAGALLRVDGAWQAVADPARHPLDFASTLAAGLATPLDAWLVARLGLESALADGRPVGEPTGARLRALGFSAPFVERFLRPFLAGVWLDRTLDVDAGVFAFYWRMLLQGRAAVPAAGMQAIPDQLAGRLAPGTLRLGARVEALVRDGAGAIAGVALADGTRLAAPAVVVATPHPEACRLLGEAPTLRGKPALTLYFAAGRPPTDRRLIALAPDACSPVGVVAVPSNVAPGYAPAGEHQVAVQALPVGDAAPALDPDEARAILAGWFPDAGAEGWRFLEAVAVPFGQFDQAPGAARVAIARGPGLFVASEAATQSSIEGALKGGLACADAVLAARPLAAAGP